MKYKINLIPLYSILIHFIFFPIFSPNKNSLKVFVNKYYNFRIALGDSESVKFINFLCKIFYIENNVCNLNST